MMKRINSQVNPGISTRRRALRTILFGLAFAAILGISTGAASAYTPGYSPGSIYGKVFYDLNKNRLFDETDAHYMNTIDSDSLFPGIRIKLYDCGNNLIAQTYTDRYGDYSFKGLKPCYYKIAIVQPYGYACTTGTIKGVRVLPGQNVSADLGLIKR